METAKAFSSRLDWDTRPNKLAKLLQRKREAGTEIYDLTESNPTRAALNHDGPEILAALSPPDALVYEPCPAGLSCARQAIAGYYASRGQSVDPDRILLTASTSEAYAFLFKLLANPGDEVLIPAPSYPLLEMLGAMESILIRHYRLTYNEGWRLDIEALLAAVSSRTRAIIVVNPNNPTGIFLKREELTGLDSLCAEYSLALISDEVFSDYVFGPDPDRAFLLDVETSALCFTLSGLSKVVGLPQMKLGWLVVSGPEELSGAAFERLELIADTYLSVGTPVQHAAARLLNLRSGFQGRMIERFKGNLSLLGNAVATSSSCNVLRVEGGWYAVLQLPRTKTDEEWALTFLEQDDVLVQPGFFYDFVKEAHVVLSLLTIPEVFREGVERVLHRLKASASSTSSPLNMRTKQEPERR